MASLACAFRASAVVLVLAAVSLMAVPAHALVFTVNLHVDGMAGLDGNGNYSALAFAWGPAGSETQKGVAPELTITIPDDSTSVNLMQAAAAKQTFSTADLQAVASGVAVVSIHMTNVRIHSVHIAANTDGAYPQPVQIVTLTFDSVEYTFQPVNVVGQKNGAPVTYSATFHR